MIFTCPWCNGTIIIEEFNCRIIRHAILKSTGKQIDPHLNKIGCDILVSQGLVYGCTKPSRILDDVLIKCEYI